MSFSDFWIGMIFGLLATVQLWLIWKLFWLSNEIRRLEADVEFLFTRTDCLVHPEKRGKR